MAVGTLTFDRCAYQNVVCLGHILAEDGRKMSKHLGNIIVPIPLMDTHGADVVRWFMLCSGSPWSPRFLGDGPLEENSRKIVATYWNSVSFFALYASHAAWSPESARPAGERHVLDRWILAELQALVETVDTGLDAYDTAGAGRALTQFVDDLSNWYIRRSRPRFWSGDQDALSTLYACLDVLTRLFAPFIPFITEEVWQTVIRAGQPSVPESVHLAAFPVVEFGLVNPARQEVRTARLLAEAGRAARKRSKVRVRQPLGRALVGLPGGVGLRPELLDDIADELNIKRFEMLSDAADAVVDITVKPNFRASANATATGPTRSPRPSVPRHRMHWPAN